MYYSLMHVKNELEKCNESITKAIVLLDGINLDENGKEVLSELKSRKEALNKFCDKKCEKTGCEGCKFKLENGCNCTGDCELCDNPNIKM